MENQDMKAIILAELKAEGLELAEDVAVKAVRAAFRATKKIVVASESKTDDLLVPVLEVVEKPVMGLLDKIDGKDDPEL